MWDLKFIVSVLLSGVSQGSVFLSYGDSEAFRGSWKGYNRFRFFVSLHSTQNDKDFIQNDRLLRVMESELYFLVISYLTYDKDQSENPESSDEVEFPDKTGLDRFMSKVINRKNCSQSPSKKAKD